MSAPGTYAPRPGSAPLPRMVLAQAALETRLLLRNGEQVLLVAVIPVALLLLLASVPVVDVTLADLVPGLLALCVVSTAFTGLAIATGFERRYGVLLRLAVSPLPRAGLLAGKTLSVLAVEALQVLLVGGVGAALGWRPQLAGVPYAVGLLLLGTAACAGLGLLMAGTLRAEATLAAANLVYLVMLGVGGVVVPVDRFPESVQPLLELLPVTALAEGLRSALAAGSAPSLAAVAVLAGWALAGLGLAARFFRWE